MAVNTIPAGSDFLLKMSLYQRVTFTRQQAWDMLNVLYFNETYDSYCPECTRSSTFQCFVPVRPPKYRREISVGPPAIEEDIYTVIARCTRVNSHVQRFVFLVKIDLIKAGESYIPVQSVQKIGQHPSYGDLHLPELKKYSSVLSAAQVSEFKRAVSLASHDVGVGAYVYLRRVFEALVEEAHQIALLADTDWDEPAYGRSRMSEKIGMLKHHLPTFLVDHPEMYSLLSKGVHELSDHECLEHFDTLRIGIELILDEKLERQEKEKKIAAAKAALTKAVSGGGK